MTSFNSNLFLYCRSDQLHGPRIKEATAATPYHREAQQPRQDGLLHMDSGGEVHDDHHAVRARRVSCNAPRHQRSKLPETTASERCGSSLGTLPVAAAPPTQVARAGAGQALDRCRAPIYSRCQGFGGGEALRAHERSCGEGKARTLERRVRLGGSER